MATTAVCGALIIIVVGFLIAFGFKLFPSLKASTAGLPANTKPLNVTHIVKGHPVSLAIPSLNMNLTVIDGYYNQSTNSWTLTLDKAQFATTTSLPNNHEGDTFIYGHYRPEVFARLHLVQPGATATITTNNYYKFNYVFTNTYAVKPSDSSIFSYHGAPMLTIQTCSGSFFQNRQMYQFKFRDYQKI